MGGNQHFPPGRRAEGGGRTLVLAQIQPKKRITQSQFAQFFQYGIFWTVPGDTSCPDGSKYVWQRGQGAFKAEALATEVYPCFQKNFTQRSRHKKHIRSQFSKYRFHNQSASSHKGYPFLSILLFFNIGQNAFDSTPLPFEHLVEFSFNGVGSTLHCSKVGQIRHRSEETMSNIS